MKIYKLLPLILLLVYTNAYGSYTGTMPFQIGTSTPLGSENPNIIDDVIRERGTVQVNLYKLKFVGTDTTLLANDSWIVGSSSTPFLITMPAASSCANASVTKPFVITNYSTGTITLNISVDGVGSPTVSGSQTMSLFTDGTRWYEIRSKNAYDSDYLGGVIATGYARSGANSDITSITGLTTALPISEGGTGQITAATAASALGVGTEDSPTFTGITATTGSTTTHTSTTITATTGNITNISATAGTFTGNVQVDSVSGLEDADIPPDITLNNITQITNRSHNDVTGTGTYSHTSIDSHIDDTSDPHGASITQTNSTTTTATATTFFSTTANITTGNVTNLVATTATATTFYNTNLSSNSGTFTGNVRMASATGFDYLKQWRIGSTIGTGNVNFEAGTGITFSPTYSNGNGTITVTASGTSSAGGWTHTGTQTVGIAGSEIVPHGTITLDATYGITGLTDAWIPNTITLDNITQITTRQLADMQGLLSIATQTAGVAFSAVTGVPTDNTNFKTVAGTATVPVRDADGNLFASGIIGGTTTGALRIPSGTTAQRPSPASGMLRYNTTSVGTCTGGTITSLDAETIHKFTSSGTFEVTLGNSTEVYDGTSWVSLKPLVLEVLTVAGGGGGGGSTGGGGGGGGLAVTSISVYSSGTYTVTIGAGGAGGADPNSGSDGNNTVFGSTTVTGGGGGGGYGNPTGQAGQVGGSGGGGGGGETGGGGGIGGSPTVAYRGNAGGNGAARIGSYAGGGGGGASQFGEVAIAGGKGGNGGIGITYLGSYYAGGGGGLGTPPGTGTVNYGGGTNGVSSGTANSASNNTGGGGGGGATAGGNGGSGIVIIKYKTQ